MVPKTLPRCSNFRPAPIPESGYVACRFVEIITGIDDTLEAQWTRDSYIAAIATSIWRIEALPNEIDAWQPLQVVSFAHTGLAFGEMFDLDALSADSKAAEIYDCMFSGSHLLITGASGSPVGASDRVKSESPPEGECHGSQGAGSRSTHGCADRSAR